MISRSESNTPDNAAAQTAVETIAGPEHTALQPADHEAFFAALETPSAPTKQLRMAFAHHHKTIVRR